jgi:hypothetical protein
VLAEQNAGLRRLAVEPDLRAHAERILAARAERDAGERLAVERARIGAQAPVAADGAAFERLPLFTSMT